MALTYVYPRSIDYIEKLLYQQYVKFGILDVQENELCHGYKLRLSWKHGKNRYTIIKYLDTKQIIEWSERGELCNVVKEMVNFRDTKIRSVTFWTNCKDVR